MIGRRLRLAAAGVAVMAMALTGCVGINLTAPGVPDSREQNQRPPAAVAYPGGELNEAGISPSRAT